MGGTQSHICINNQNKMDGTHILINKKKITVSTPVRKQKSPIEIMLEETQDECARSLINQLTNWKLEDIVQENHNITQKSFNTSGLKCNLFDPTYSKQYNRVQEALEQKWLPSGFSSVRLTKWNADIRGDYTFYYVKFERPY